MTCLAHWACSHTLQLCGVTGASTAGARLSSERVNICCRPDYTAGQVELVQRWVTDRKIVPWAPTAKQVVVLGQSTRYSSARFGGFLGIVAAGVVSEVHVRPPLAVVSTVPFSVTAVQLVTLGQLTLSTAHLCPVTAHLVLPQDCLVQVLPPLVVTRIVP